MAWDHRSSDHRLQLPRAQAALFALHAGDIHESCIKRNALPFDFLLDIGRSR